MKSKTHSMRQNTERSFRLAAGAIPLLTAVLAPAAIAQDAQTQTAQATGAIEEIVVSGTRRIENLQDVPISVNAFNSDDISKQRIQEFGDLAVAIPGFSINTLTKSRLNPALRGGSSSLAAAGAEGAVGLFIDDQYFGGPGDFEIDLFDVERIEVLRGPQGTLFGRNTTGGSINVVTKDPTEEFEAKVAVTAGNFNLFQARGLISGPVKEGVYGLVAFSHTDRDGTSFNETTGNRIDTQNKSSVRTKFLFDVNETLDITTTASYTRHDETGVARDALFLDEPVTQSLLVDQGFVPDDNTRRTTQFSDGRYESEQFTFGLEIDKSFEYGQLLSITSYRYLDTDHAQNSLAGAPTELFAFGEPRQVNSFSQEFRYVSEFNGPFNFVGGAFLYFANEDRNITNTNHWDANTVGGSFQAITFCPTQTSEDFDNFTITPSCLGSGLITVGNQTVTLDSLYQPSNFTVDENVKTSSYAVFGEGKYDIGEAITLTFGGRWTFDEKELEGGTDGAPDFFWNPQPGLRVEDSENWDEFTYRFGVDWHVTDDILFYASTSKGFRAGAYEITQSDPALSGAAVDPETVFSHEVGFKSQFWGNRAQLNVTLFDANYEDLQFFVNTGSASITTNAGEAEVRGIELDFLALLTSNLEFRFQWSHQDGDSSDIPVDAEIADGTPPQGTVPNTFIASLNYASQLESGAELTFGVDFTHKDPYGLEFNDTPQFQSEVRSLVNARIGYTSPGGNWDLSVWGKNLTDEDIVIYGQDFWFTFYNTAAFTATPDLIEQTAQPRYADPLTFGATWTYNFQ